MTDENTGYKDLVDDLNALTQEAIKFEFDDFQNEKYAAPKIELVNRLYKLIENVRDGRYDQ